MDSMELRKSIEALLFASEKPLSAEEMKEAFEEDIPAKDIKIEIEALRAEYEETRRGFRIYEIAGGFQLASAIDFAEVLKRFYQARDKKKMSPASLETLSVIAYRQPVTRAEIEAIRGVNVDGAMKGLMDKGLIRITGRKEVPGRPLLYGTTRDFLDRFGLKALDELPPLSEYSIKDLDPALLPPELKMQESSVEGVSEAGGETAETV